MCFVAGAPINYGISFQFTDSPNMTSPFVIIFGTETNTKWIFKYSSNSNVKNNQTSTRNSAHLQQWLTNANSVIPPAVA